MNETEYSLVEFGQRIKAVRKQLNMTQKEFANAIDLSSSFISDIESGRSKACLDFFYTLANKFNVNLYYLILGEGEIIGSKSQRPSLGNKKIGQSIDNVDELLWYIEHSSMIRHTLMGFASRFIYENREHILKEIDETTVQPTD